MLVKCKVAWINLSVHGFFFFLSMLIEFEIVPPWALKTILLTWWFWNLETRISLVRFKRSALLLTCWLFIELVLSDCHLCKSIQSGFLKNLLWVSQHQDTGRVNSRQDSFMINHLPFYAKANINVSPWVRDGACAGGLFSLPGWCCNARFESETITRVGFSVRQSGKPYIRCSLWLVCFSGSLVRDYCSPQQGGITTDRVKALAVDISVPIISIITGSISFVPLPAAPLY